MPILVHAMPTEQASSIATDGNYQSCLIARIDLEQTDEIIEALLRVEAYYEQEGPVTSHPPLLSLGRQWLYFSNITTRLIRRSLI